MKIHRINEAGKKRIAEFLQKYSNGHVMERIHVFGFESFQYEAEDSADRGDFKIELGAYYTRHGRPEILQFAKSDFNVEEIEG